MAHSVTRRAFFATSGFGASAGLLLSSRTLPAATQVPAALIKGDNRRQNIADALKLIDKEIALKLKGDRKSTRLNSSHRL